jgi:anti-sigma28 factor (negative regulator of flagellin synthesis)
MEISSLSNPYPQDPGKRSEKAQENKKSGQSRETDSFEGPKTGEFINELKKNDFIRESLVNDVKEEIKAGNYFTEERIQKVVEKLSSHL